MDRGRWGTESGIDRSRSYGPSNGSHRYDDGRYGPVGPDRRPAAGPGGPPGPWRDGGRGRDEYTSAPRAGRDARSRSRSRSRSPRSRGHPRQALDGDRDRARERDRFRGEEHSRHERDRDDRDFYGARESRDYPSRGDGPRRDERASADMRSRRVDDGPGQGRDGRSGIDAATSRDSAPGSSSAAAAAAAAAVDGDEDDDVEEDEEAAAARLLEESKKRREAILAKHRAAKEATDAVKSVIAPTATEVAAGASANAPAPGVASSVPSASVMGAHGVAAREAMPSAPLTAPAVSVAPAAVLNPAGGAPTAPASAAASAMPAMRVGRSMFDDGDDDDDEAYFAAVGSSLRTGAAGRATGMDGTAALLAARREDGDGYGEGGGGAAGGAGAVAGSTVAGSSDLSLADNWDDHDGYYRLRMGETIGPAGRYRVLGTRGRGVFSSVLYCKDLHAGEAGAGIGSAAAGLPAGTEDDDEAAAREAAAGTIATAAAPLTVSSSGAVVRGHAALATGSSEYVAVKLLRSNDTMRRAGQRELELLRTIATADPTGRYHCVRLLHSFEHRGHLCLAFEPLNMNLKEVQNKFGKGVGISIGAVRSYARQMLLSLSLLAKLRIVHADIKPHNILANERYNVIKLADFGSGFKEDDPDNLPTPLLVSRFYRAPEIILGYPHTPALDMWSVACCLYELYTGSPLFPGVDNNDMLWLHQCLKGRFPHRMLRFHLRQVEAYGFEAQFAPDLRFKRALQDPVSRAPITKMVDVTAPSTDLGAALLAKRAADDDKRAVLALRDLLEAMLALDPAKRISVKDAMNHPFIRGGGGGSSSGHGSASHSYRDGGAGSSAGGGAGMASRNGSL